MLARTELRPTANELSSAPFQCLLVDHPHEQAAALSALLASLAGPEVRVIQLGNATGLHRKLQRILVDVTGSGGRVLRSEDARLTVRALAERQARESRVLLVVGQAETLRAEVLRSLQAMAPHFSQPGQPTLQVLFVGRPVFRTLLLGDDMAPLRQALGLSAGPARQRAVPRAPEAPMAAFSGPATSRKRVLIPLALLFLSLAAGVAALLVASGSGGNRPQPTRAAMVPPPPLNPRELPLRFEPASKPSPTALPPPAPAPAPAHDQATPPVADDPVPDGPAPLQPATQDREPTGAPAPVPVASAAGRDLGVPAIPRTGPRIVIHVPNGSPATEALSDRVLGGLRDRPGTVEVRHVPETPGRPSIRFFRAEDEPAARQAGAWLGGTGLSWTVQDFSSFRPLPSRGTVEVWLPRQD